MTYVAPSHTGSLETQTVAQVQPADAQTVAVTQQPAVNQTPAGKRKRNPDALKKCMACGELINGDYFAYQHIKSKPCAQLVALGITNQVEYDEHFYQLKADIVEPPTVERARKTREKKAAAPAVEQVQQPAVVPVVEQVQQPAVVPVVEQVQQPAVVPAVEQVQQPAVVPVVEQVQQPAVVSGAEQSESLLNAVSGEVESLNTQDEPAKVTTADTSDEDDFLTMFDV